MAGEGHSVERACRVLHVAESGYYAWRERAPSARTVRHAWLTEAILGIHAASRGTYGFRRVHAELALGSGIHVHHGAVPMLMRRAGLHGLPGNRTRRPRPETPSVADPVNRNFTRQARDQLWVTDITEHATLEGEVYCAVVLDTSRRVVGWSIDASPNAALVTNALSMAISNRRPQPGSTIIHSDHGVHSSAPGPSRNGPAPLGCCPPWARSGTAWTSTCHHTAPLLLSGSL
ncbi:MULTISPECIES: IS3 family transposase [Streptomyces violaceusniger group]|uniref:Integrase catalytic domain-containing protein n=2 Tax=Streptomyces rhizosphaericus TaxID=114699 RepID=A0ABN1R9W7_9ACTN